MNLDELRVDCAIRQKKGLHFILASVVIWCAVLAVHLTSLPSETKNLLITALAAGCLFPPYILAVCMVIVEVLFSIVLIFENRKIKKTAYAVSST